MREHLARVQMFLELGRKATTATERFRFFIAGVYFSRGIIELILEASDKQQIRTTRTQLKDQLPKRLPWFSLIERIRIHDFHRVGLVPPDPDVKMVMQRGPIRLHAREGAAVYMIQPEGPQKCVTGASEIDEQRPLLTFNDRFLDDETGKYVTLEDILTQFVVAASGVVNAAERSIQEHDYLL